MREHYKIHIRFKCYEACHTVKKINLIQMWYNVPKNPLHLGILGKPPGDYSNGRDLTLTVRGYSLAIMSTSIEAASLTLGKINPIVREICLTLRQLHKEITLNLEYIP